MWLSISLLVLSCCLSSASYTCENIALFGIAETDTYHVSNMTAVPASNSTGSSAFCDLQIVIGGRINAWVRLPDTSNWNGRFVQYGCGGACGYNPFDDADASYGGPVAALARGYAVSTTDMGELRPNVARLTDQLTFACSGLPYGDSNYLPFHNNFQMRVDWGHLATHLTTIVSKEVIETYYGAAPSFSYHLGGSTGGRQGLGLVFFIQSNQDPSGRQY